MALKNALSISSRKALDVDFNNWNCPGVGSARAALPQVVRDTVKLLLCQQCHVVWLLLVFATLLKPRPHYLLHQLIRDAAVVGPLHILQIGANDGIYVDPVHCLLVRHRSISATRVEPIPIYFQQLQRHCSLPSLRDRVRCVQAAVCSTDGMVEMLLPDPSEAIGTFRQGIARLRQLGDLMHDPKIKYQSVSVPSISPKTLLQKSISDVVDVYISDCEGYDIELACMMPFAQMRTRLVYLEIQATASASGQAMGELGNQLGRIWSLLGAQGFNQVVWDGFNLIAWKSPPAATSRRPRLISIE